MGLMDRQAGGQAPDGSNNLPGREFGTGTVSRGSKSIAVRPTARPQALRRLLIRRLRRENDCTAAVNRYI